MCLGAKTSSATLSDFRAVGRLENQQRRSIRRLEVLDAECQTKTGIATAS